MQMIFQDPFASLNPRKSIVENIGAPLLHHRIAKNLLQRDEQVAHVLSEVGLSPDAMHRYPHQFSGGQQQRVCIGRALALNPQMIVCDEAVSALDVSVQAQVLNLLADLRYKRNLSYLFISHDLSVIRHLCDRVAVLYLGKVVETATTEELFNNPKHPYTRFLLSAVPKEHPREKRERLQVTGEIPSPANPPKGCPFHTRCPFAQSTCATQPPPTKSFIGSDGRRHTYSCILN
jgi:peptide/nickel transport system ATP-binding protein